MTDPLRAAILGDGETPTEPLPCPWCEDYDGVSVKSDTHSPSGELVFIVACAPCGISTSPWTTRDAAVDSWNGKPRHADVDEAAARVRAMLTSDGAIQRAAGTVGAPRDAMTEEAERIALKAILAALGNLT